MASSPLYLVPSDSGIEPSCEEPSVEQHSQARQISSVVMFALINLGITVTVFTAVFAALAN